ncbi:unnamed protein product [Phaedon cochleariae]|uniref:Uncharacterized protein n=1 Tax=Phaedon cochleariae TaxID=80249 RepID=A0A9P0DBM4_PHACE|nr:unnamed protein product [Phaedon cochleariae]
MENGDSKLKSNSFDGNDYIFENPLNFEPNEQGLGHLYFTSMKKYQNNTLQYLADSGEEDTYSDVLTRCIRTALHLQQRGLTKDDIVILCTNNHKNSCVPFIASLFIGVPVASLDPSLSVMDTSHLLREVKPRIIFVIPKALELIEISLQEAGAESDIVVFGKTDKYTDFSEFLEPCEDEAKFVPAPVDNLQETALILFSSGTTGLPKGILIHHYALLAQANTVLQSGNSGPVSLSYASLYWISAVLFLTATISSGGARLVCSTFDPSELWDLIEKYRLSNLFLIPSQAADMVNLGRPDGLDTTSLWSCMTGGAAISEKCLADFRDLLPGTFVYQVYGQSEVAGIISLFNTYEVKESLYLHYKPRSVGLVAPGLRCKVVDPDTEKLCGPNEHGELRIDTKLIMNGYYNKDSSEAFDSGGWLRTGDIVYYDEDKCLFVVDRIKEMLKFKSWHVAPAMIEQVLTNHPAVGNAVVIGIPHEEDGDYPMGLVILNPEYHGDVQESDIEHFVAERVPDRMRLRAGVRIMKEFPMTPSGKPKRKELRERVLRGEL